MAVATAVAVAGVAVSAYGAYSSNRNAREAGERQEDAMDSQVALDRERLDFSREQYDDYTEMFGPVLGDLRTMAYEESEPDYAGITADVGAAYDTSQDINRRTQQRYGVNPSDGAANDGELRYGVARAQGIVDARNKARAMNKDSKFNRLSSFYSLGNGQGDRARSLMDAAYAGASSTYGQHGAAFGNQAAAYGQQAQQYGQDAAGWAGWGYGQYQAGRTPSTPQFQPSPGYGARPTPLGMGD